MQKETYFNTILWDSSRPMKERITYLLSNLTLEEKLCFLATRQPALPRLGIREFSFGGEAAHGVEARHDQDQKGAPEETTSLIQPIGMSASWDMELVEEAGSIVGTEARVLYERHKNGGLSRWAPTVDMERDPRWGRTEEGYGEDPYLTGKMASAYIRGLQGNDGFYLRMAATLKHFYANNVEEGRVSQSSSIDPRNKYEYYLEPFRRAVTEGGAEAMMTAYNEINGVPAIVNQEVQKLVKDEWGMKGHVVCDGGDMMQNVEFHHYCGTHAQTVAEGLKAGIDCFTDDAAEVKKAATEAFALNLISEEDIDRALAHTFGTRIRLGLFDAVSRNPYAAVDETDINAEKGKEISRMLAEEGAVLLKNENGFLPLTGTERIAAIGPLGNEWFRDWYGGEPPYRSTPLSGIEKFLGRTVEFESGLPEICLRCRDGYAGFGEDGRLSIVAEQEKAARFLWNDWGTANSTFFSMENGRYLSFHEEEDDFFADKTEAFGWFVKERFEVRKTDKGYRLCTWNGKELVRKEDGSFGTNGDNKEEFELEILRDGAAAAARLASRSDKVLFFAGCQPVLCSKEEIDRENLELPQFQQELVKSVYSENPSVAMILLTNYPYSIVWEQEHIPAILTMATGSQEMGNALANLVFGRSVPSGKLPLTWYQSEMDLPDINDYDIIQGKRTYRYFEKEVLYPFGHGLSYASFSYEDLKADIRDKRELSVQFSVTNTGNVTADEVAEIYAVRQSASRILHPKKRLIGFERLRKLKPGETRVVHKKISCKELAVYDVTRQCMIVEKGIYNIAAGGSSEQMDQVCSVQIPGEQTGVRETLRITPADCYDSYENIFLHRADTVGTCAAVKVQENRGILTYGDFIIQGVEARIILNMQCKNAGKLIVRVNDKRAAEWKGDGLWKFHNVELGLEEIVKNEFKEGDLLELVLELYGDVRISRFRFEQND